MTPCVPPFRDRFRCHAHVPGPPGGRRIHPAARLRGGDYCFRSPCHVSFRRRARAGHDQRLADRTVSSFLTDFTPDTMRACSEAFAAAVMLGTSPVSVTTPPSVRTSTFFS